jgi:hypothetical protein
MRTRDLEAWKKEFEFWRSREKGKQALNVLLLNILFMNELQLSVILLLNPTSNGTGNVLVAAAVLALPVVDAVAVDFTVEVAMVELADELLTDEEELPPCCDPDPKGSSLFRRSSAD